jgi:16S rRNA (guanine(966)-N(2))-methyltransferase RsmD
MLRVIAGTAKNKKLLALEGETRPVTDRIKTMVFDSIREFIPEAIVLDLFAGSGSYGIEALSRGAASSVFVEANPEAVELIKQNLENTGFSSKSTIVAERLPGALNHNSISIQSDQFDVIFCDPPFTKLEEFDLGDYVSLINTENLFILRLPSSNDKSEDFKFRQALSKEYNIELLHSEKIGVSQLYFLRKRV